MRERQRPQRLAAPPTRAARAQPGGARSSDPAADPMLDRATREDPMQATQAGGAGQGVLLPPAARVMAAVSARVARVATEARRAATVGVSRPVRLRSSRPERGSTFHPRAFTALGAP